MFKPTCKTQVSYLRQPQQPKRYHHSAPDRFTARGRPTGLDAWALPTTRTLHSWACYRSYEGDCLTPGVLHVRLPRDTPWWRATLPRKAQELSTFYGLLSMSTTRSKREDAPNSFMSMETRFLIAEAEYRSSVAIAALLFPKHKSFRIDLSPHLSG